MKKLSVEELVSGLTNLSPNESNIYLVGNKVVYQLKYNNKLVSKVEVEKYIDNWSQLNLTNTVPKLKELAEKSVEYYKQELNNAIEEVVSEFKEVSKKHKIPIYIRVEDFLRILSIKLDGMIDTTECDCDGCWNTDKILLYKAYGYEDDDGKHEIYATIYSDWLENFDDESNDYVYIVIN